jgi:hypothetical protein
MTEPPGPAEALDLESGADVGRVRHDDAQRLVARLGWSSKLAFVIRPPSWELSSTRERCPARSPCRTTSAPGSKASVSAASGGEREGSPRR